MPRGYANYCNAILYETSNPRNMEYALAGIDNNLFAAHYQLYLPNKAEL